MMSFEQSMKYFKEHQIQLAKSHYKKFVVICDGEVIDFYDDQLVAYLEAKEKFPDKQFVLARCIKPEEEPVPYFHSRVR